MSEADLIPDKPDKPDKPRKQAEILDVVQDFFTNKFGENLLTMGGLTIPVQDIKDKRKGINLCVLHPVTETGKLTLNNYVKEYERNYDVYRNPSQGPRRKYTPVTTLEVDEAAIEVLETKDLPQPKDLSQTKEIDLVNLYGFGGGKRNKSKKPKRRNSRSKRRKTVSKRRR
jgi:hypothetical protein